MRLNAKHKRRVRLFRINPRRMDYHCFEGLISVPGDKLNSFFSLELMNIKRKMFKKLFIVKFGFKKRGEKKKQISGGLVAFGKLH